VAGRKTRDGISFVRRSRDGEVISELTRVTSSTSKSRLLEGLEF
jgi:hypothetical protein